MPWQLKDQDPAESHSHILLPQLHEAIMWKIENSLAEFLSPLTLEHMLSFVFLKVFHHSGRATSLSWKTRGQRKALNKQRFLYFLLYHYWIYSVIQTYFPTAICLSSSDAKSTGFPTCSRPVPGENSHVA